MKVAVFFDGKNFYTGWREQAQGRQIDFAKLALWLATLGTKQPTFLVSARYYTGVEPGEGVPLARFLDRLEFEPGYTVRRFARCATSFRCESCQTVNPYTQEKEVDTAIAVDMVRMAALDQFDAAVLVSGDVDLLPAVEGVQLFGKPVYVASWSSAGMSPRLRRAAHAHLDMATGEGFFHAPGAVEEVEAPEAVSSELAPRGMEEVFLENLRAATRQFSPGYVGVNYFVTRWRGLDFPPDPILRRSVLDGLVSAKRVEVYDANDNKALREIVPVEASKPVT